MGMERSDGALLANGGAQTTEGSIMAAKNVNLRITRQDDVSQMQGNLVKFAQDYKANPASATTGCHFVTIMGDGAAAFLAGVNPQLEKLGKDYRAQIVYTCGRSLGEDKFMGPAAWKQNPQTAKGGVCAAVLRDGDWNIVIKWCGDIVNDGHSLKVWLMGIRHFSFYGHIVRFDDRQHPQNGI